MPDTVRPGRSSVLHVDVPIRQARTYDWLRLPAPVRPELDEPRSDGPSDWEPEPGLGAVSSVPVVVPPTNGAVAGRGVGRSAGDLGVTPVAPEVLGVEPGPESVRPADPGDVGLVGEAGGRTGALLVPLDTPLGAEAPVPA